MNNPGLLALALALLLALDLETTAASSALLNANLAHLVAYGEPDDPRLQRALSLLRLPEGPQAALELVQIVWRTLLTVLFFVFLYEQPWRAPLLTASALTLVAILLVFWLEWAVRVWARRSADAWVVQLGPFTLLLSTVLAPLTALPRLLSAEQPPSADDFANAMVDELKTLVDAGEREGSLEVGERRMLRSIFELGDTLAREIMVPRIDILALDVDTPLTEAVDVLLKTGHTRIPVYQDTVDNVLGVLYAKDLLRVWREGNTTGSMKALLRPAYFVPEAKKVDELLAEMQSRRVHVALVVDEYGGIAGLVTLEDIVEEIVGEIQDEYDLGEESPYHELEDGEYIFLGRVDLDDFNDVLNQKGYTIHLSKDEAETLGGFIYNRLGRVPAAGEWVQVEDLRLIVEQVSGRRIRKVRVKREAPSLDDEESISHDDG